MTHLRLKWHFFAWLARKFVFKLTSNSFFFFFQIYTEWANYYLERHKSKRKVVDLSVDARDGLLLAEIVEAVTSFKVPDLIKKPKSQQQMVSQSMQSIKPKILVVFRLSNKCLVSRLYRQFNDEDEYERSINEESERKRNEIR